MDKQIKDLTDLELAMHLEQNRFQFDKTAQSIAALQQELNLRLQKADAEKSAEKSV